MGYGQVNSKFLMTLLLGVAFATFSISGHASLGTTGIYTGLEWKDPQLDLFEMYHCRGLFNDYDIDTSVDGQGVPIEYDYAACYTQIIDLSAAKYSAVGYTLSSCNTTVTGTSTSVNCEKIVTSTGASLGYVTIGQLLSVNSQIVASCPPVQWSSYDYPVDSDADGETDQCYSTADVQQALTDEAALNQQQNQCEGLMMSENGNSTPQACFTSNTGIACKMNLNTSESGISYYSGFEIAPLGCASSGLPLYNPEESEDPDDNCIFTPATQNDPAVTYCTTSKDTHCSIVQGSEICDDGCLEVGEEFFCNADKYPDVGNGNSDYFDDNGTCDVVAGSAYRGACEDLGGTWNKEDGDYQKESCPVATAYSGSCSIAVWGSCYSCLDDGGAWTPSTPTEQTPIDQQVLQDIANNTSESNQNLNTIDNSIRKGNDSINSTLNNVGDKIVSAINNKVIGGGGGDSSTDISPVTDELKKQNDGVINNTAQGFSGWDSMFSTESITTLETEIETKQTEIKTFKDQVKTELDSLVNFTVPTGAGYELRNIVTKWGNVDASLSRYSSFFISIQPAVYLLASVIALYILLGGMGRAD